MVANGSILDMPQFRRKEVNSLCKTFNMYVNLPHDFKGTHMSRFVHILNNHEEQITVDSFKKSLLGATKTSCMIAFILAGSTFLSLAMGFTGLPRNLAIWIQNMDLSPYLLILVLMIFYIILGMFLDGISAVVLTMAIIEPMIRQAGFDMIWFGIFLVIVVEMAQITPPVGFNLFVLQGMANKDMGYIARSAFPLFLLMVLAVILVVIFPEIALWLPQQMVQNLS